MWASRRTDGAMESPLGYAQPWTPPETDTEPSPRTDYFSDPYSRPHDDHSPVTVHQWSSSQDKPPTMGARCDTPTDEQRGRPRPVTTATAPAPYTPTKTYSLDGLHAHGAPQYPYTPDSSRILRRNTELPSSPIPWDDYDEQSPSPVQNALSSCIAHFENLLQMRQPDEDQMEYIVGQFEAMASYLSAPDAQSRGTDEHLFSDQDLGLGGLGITANPDASPITDTSLEANPASVNEQYVAQVETYITGVQKYIQDLKMRMDEVKTLNSIQLDVIHDLRCQMKTVRQGMRSSLSLRDEYTKDEVDLAASQAIDSDDEHADTKSEGRKEFGVESWETLVNDDHDDDTAAAAVPEVASKRPASPQRRRKSSVHFSEEALANAQKRRTITIIHRPERRSFWSSIGEALDSFGSLFHEE